MRAANYSSWQRFSTNKFTSEQLIHNLPYFVVTCWHTESSTSFVVLMLDLHPYNDNYMLKNERKRLYRAKMKHPASTEQQFLSADKTADSSTGQ